MLKSIKKLRLALVVLVLAASTFASFSFVDNYFEISKNLDIFATLFREINIYYVDEIDPGKLMKTGIDAMLESLDPYTNYITESEIEDYRFMTTGQYGGIGALIQQKGDSIIVKDPYEGFPAQKADLRAGDVILEIDGRSTVGKKTDDISKILKGQPKTPVRLVICRFGEKKLIEKVITRDEIKVKSVPYYAMLDEHTGYIRLNSFTESASRELKDAMQDLKAKGKLESLVLDLRGNPGGLLNEAVNIVNLFVDKGKEIVSTKGKVAEWDKSYKALNTPVDTQVPLVVLVNSGSASASEIVSGAIQDLDRGVILGQRSYGKGLVQTTRPLTYNTQLKVTTAKYYIPSGRCIQALDYTHRNEDGSVGKVPDSLMNSFKTKGGRMVKDGGGILPDVVMAPEKLSNIAGSLLGKYLIFDFATRYRTAHESIPAVKDFHLSDSDFNDFVAFLGDKEYDYTTKSEKALQDLKENSEQEKYFSDIKVEYEALHSKMMHNKKEDLVKNKEELMALLTEEIASRYYFQNGHTEASLATDPEVRRAIALLQDKAGYNAILATPVKAGK